MKFYARKQRITVFANVPKLELMLALLDEKNLISEPEKALRIAGPHIFAAFLNFNAAEIREAIREAEEKGSVEEAALYGIPYASAEEEEAKTRATARGIAAAEAVEAEVKKLEEAEPTPEPESEPVPEPKPTKHATKHATK